MINRKNGDVESAESCDDKIMTATCEIEENIGAALINSPYCIYT